MIFLFCKNIKTIFAIPNLQIIKFEHIMIIVKVKEGENIDRALRRFKRKFDKTGVIKQIRARQAFKKPSEVNRMKIQKAIYIEQLKRKAEL